MNILFTRAQEFPTNRVIDWLYYYNKEHIKYTADSSDKKHLDFSEKKFAITYGGTNKKEISDALFEGDEINAVWFRSPNHSISHYLEDFEYDGVYPKAFLDHTIKNRFAVFNEFVAFLLKRKNHIGSFEKTGLNKPIVLSKAQEVGLLIPKTSITNSKESLISFFNECNHRIITKSIQELAAKHEELISEFEQEDYFQLTELIEDLADTPEIFAPSLFQEYIEKEFEIRTTYLDGNFYSGAIFTQLNDQTKVDMRNRDANVATRYVPYKLPNHVEKSAKQLMETLDLNFGVIDFIKSTNGQHYFLEINPMGQYGDISMYCNYNLHKKIAELLINEQDQ